MFFVIKKRRGKNRRLNPRRQNQLEFFLLTESNIFAGADKQRRIKKEQPHAFPMLFDAEKMGLIGGETGFSDGDKHNGGRSIPCIDLKAFLFEVSHDPFDQMQT